MNLPNNAWETYVFSTCFNLTLARGIKVSNNLLTIREPLQLALFLLINQEKLTTFQQLDLTKAKEDTPAEIFQLIPNLFPEGSTQRTQDVLRGSSLLTYPDDFGFSIVAQIDAFLTPENAKLLKKLGLDAANNQYGAKLLEIVYSILFWFLHDLPKEDSFWEALHDYSSEKESEYGPIINIINGEEPPKSDDSEEEEISPEFEQLLDEIFGLGGEGEQDFLNFVKKHFDNQNKDDHDE